MKIIKLMIPLLSLLLLACGGSDNNTTNNNTVIKPMPVQVVSYDLSTYLVPDTNLTHVYSAELSEKKDDDPYRNISPSYPGNKYEGNQSLMNMTINNVLVKKYDTRENIILLDDFENNHSIEYKRYVGLGETIFEFKYSETVDSLPSEATYSCKFVQHLDEKVVIQAHEDIIEINCVIVEEGESTLAGVSISIESRTEETLYFAKNKGLISSTEEKCSISKVGINTPNKTCTKIETKWITTTY